MNLKNFEPFDVTIWGSVSDWVMIFVTTVTAFFLYKTLKEQRKIIEIEQERHRIQIMPSIDVVYEKKFNWYKIIALNNNLYKINIRTIYLGNEVEYSLSENHEILDMYSAGSITTFTIKSNEKFEGIIQLILNTVYSDAIGNKYSVQIIIQFPNKIKVSFPYLFLNKNYKNYA